MERRRLPRLLAPLTAVILCAVTFAAASAQEAPRTLRLAFILPVESQLGVGATTFASEVSAHTAGRYRVDPYPGAMAVVGLATAVALLALVPRQPAVAPSTKEADKENQDGRGFNLLVAIGAFDTQDCRREDRAVSTAAAMQ